MTLTPSPTGDLGLDQPNHRAAGLALALGARKMRRNGKVRYFLGPRKAEQFAALYAAGFWALRRGATVSFKRDPRGLHLYAALAVCRNGCLTTNGGLATNEIIHQD